MRLLSLVAADEADLAIVGDGALAAHTRRLRRAAGVEQHQHAEAGEHERRTKSRAFDDHVPFNPSNKGYQNVALVDGLITLV